MNRRNTKIIIIISAFLVLTIFLGIFYYKEKNMNFNSNIENHSNTINVDDMDLNEGDIPNIQPHIDSKTGTKYITYEDIQVTGEVIDGIEDSYYKMKKTHEVANKYGYEVRAKEGETYHIFKLHDTSPIMITTNTDWNNATIVIHDENINGYETSKEPIIEITSEKATTDLYVPQKTLPQLKIDTSTKKIEQLAGHGECLCFVWNQEKEIHIRDGIEGQGYYQYEVFRVDNEGNLLNDIEWDYEKVTRLVYRQIDPENITIKNANIKTILNEKGEQLETGYLARNIVCNRSNVKISNIKHTVDDNTKTGGPYYGLFKISNASNVSLEDVELVSYQCQKQRKSNYDLTIDSSTNVTMRNVTSNDINDTGKWGVTGTNDTKDITYENCTLNRIDAHRSVHNLNIIGCTLGVYSISVTGNGNLNIEDTVSYNTDCFIRLREDYGSTWNGNINIKNCTMKNITNPTIVGFLVSYRDGKLCDYGYDLHLPNLNIDGLDIYDENVDDSSEDFYVFYNSKENTGVENGDLRNNYILPKNVTIKNYTTTSGRKMKLFYNKFYNSLDELGINLSMPLKDKIEAKIIDSHNEPLQNGSLIKDDIIIKTEEVEGIQTIVKVNDKQVSGNENTLSADEDYNIEITYQNFAGESETINRNITIDKTPPIILGVQEGGKYKNDVIPKIEEKNLKEVKVLLNGQEITDYTLNSTLNKEGIYQIKATDKVENSATVNFQILELMEEDYRITDDKIKNIDNNTTKNLFDQKFASSRNYEIKRENDTLSNEDIIKTGDILQMDTGEKYTLIVTGDINGDGDVNIKDVVKLRKYLLYKDNMTDIELVAADTNLDNQDISIKDLVRMRIVILTKE